MELKLAGVSLPIRLRPHTPMTNRELMRFCAANDTVRVERERDGDILVMTPSGSKISMMNMRLGRLLDEWAEADRRGVAFDSSGGFLLPDGSMRAADAAWIARERWDALKEEEQEGFAPLCPDFVIELRSNSDRLHKVRGKMEQDWMANGAKLAWLIDPQDRSVTIYRPGARAEVLKDPASVQGEDPVAGFRLPLSRLWETGLD